MPFTDPPPRDDLIETDSRTGKALKTISRTWRNYIQDAIVGGLNATPGVVARVRKAGASAIGASIPATPIPGPALTAQFYRVSYFVRCSRASGATSSFTLTFGFLSGGIAISIAEPALTGNVTNAVQESTLFLKVDAPGPITYAVTYATTGIPDAQFELDIVVEAISLPA